MMKQIPDNYLLFYYTYAYIDDTIELIDLGDNTPEEYNDYLSDIIIKISNISNDRVGQIFTSKSGLEYKIIKYYNANNISIQCIKTGYIIEERQYNNIKKGNINHPLIYEELDNNISKITNVDLDFSFLIDTEDLEKVMKYRWYPTNGYSSTRINNKHIFLHRFLLNITDSKTMCDHKDMNILNNCKNNLRICNMKENIRNRKSRSKTGYKGIYLNKNGSIYVQFQIDGKKINFGTYTSLKEAVNKSNKVMIEFHKEFANLNEYKEIDE